MLSSPAAKATYDLSLNANNNVLSAKPTPPLKNKDVVLVIDVTLFDIIYGKTVLGVVSISSGAQPFEITIPSGVKHKDRITFKGLGDDR